MDNTKFGKKSGARPCASKGFASPAPVVMSCQIQKKEETATVEMNDGDNKGLDIFVSENMSIKESFYIFLKYML
jgi:hypothetical protein